MTTTALFPAETLSITLAIGAHKFAKDTEKSKDKNLHRDPTLTPDHVKARRMRTAAKAPSAIPAATGKDGHVSLSAGNSALGRESALWGARSLWGEGALWGGPAAKGNSALYGDSALWGNALCGERQRRMPPAA